MASEPDSSLIVWDVNSQPEKLAPYMLGHGVAFFTDPKLASGGYHGCG
jgi:hypothetical protein